MIVTTTSGNVNLERTSAKVCLFQVPTDAHRRDGKEAHAFLVAREQGGCISTVGSPRFYEAVSGYRTEFGKWVMNTLEVEEGVLLKLYMNRKTQDNVPGRMRSASMLLQSREGAALLRITCTLPQDDRMQLSTVRTEGRFDVLDVRQAEALGAKVPPAFRLSFEPEAANGMFYVEEIEPERSPRPHVSVRTSVDDEGKVTRTRTRHPGRALDI